jgi:protein-tyrosine phosphatase
LFLFISLGVSLANGKDLAFSTSMLIYDATIEKGKLRNYRNVTECLYNAEKFARVNLQGLAALKISGSAQFSTQHLPYILKYVTGKLFILDLRQESHGFINKKAFTLYGYRNQANIKKTAEQIFQEEKQLLLTIAKQQKITLHKICKHPDGNFTPTKDITVQVKNVAAEQELVQQSGINYQRFYVLDRHKPDDEQVDAFVKFVKNLPANAWLHFHCRAGKGRTTTFMIMYDMIRNAKQVAFKDILTRHVLLSGAMLDDFSKNVTNPWTLQPALDRYDFLQRFYQYVIVPDGYDKQEWETWIKHKL